VSGGAPGAGGDGAGAVERAAAMIRPRLAEEPRVGLVLGSGLGALADELSEPVRIPFGDIPGFAVPAVVGHAGMLVAGRLEGVPCIVLQGRYHVYEGHPAAAVAFPVRVMAALGARALIVTNAAGALSLRLRPGDLMVIEDHINLLGQNPLTGPVLPGEERFPDMTVAYDPALRALAENVALERGIRVSRGIYCAVAGPSYETPSEVRMLQRLGGDAVGMSTVPEVVTARARGMRVLGISLISNVAAGLTPEPLDHREVIEAGREAAGRFSALVRGVLAGMEG
jgi:purine-nucleoside phosphorylase